MKINIEVHADTLCPWSYIEKRSLDEAMERYTKKHPDTEFEVIWRPFYLNPLMKSGVEKLAFYETRNKPGQSSPFLERIQKAGSKRNITFSLAGKTGHSRNSHKLIALALERAGPAAQSQAVERLFRGHFEEDRDVTDEAWLLDVGRDAGLPEDAVREALASEAAGREVDEAARRAREQDGVEAVPCVTLQGRFRVGGYQEEDVFEGLFERIRAEMED